MKTVIICNPMLSASENISIGMYSVITLTAEYDLSTDDDCKVITVFAGTKEIVI